MKIRMENSYQATRRVRAALLQHLPNAVIERVVILDILMSMLTFWRVIVWNRPTRVERNPDIASYLLLKIVPEKLYSSRVRQDEIVANTTKWCERIPVDYYEWIKWIGRMELTSMVRFSNRPLRSWCDC